MFKMGEQELELSQLAGQAIDPRKQYPDLVSLIASPITVAPSEHFYYHQKAKNTDKIYVITSTGALTQLAISPTADTELTFVDIVTPLDYVKWNDLNRAKEATVARKRLDIERELDAYENYYMIALAAAACSSSGNQVTLGSSITTFNVAHVVEMIDDVTDYASNFSLVLGRTVFKDFVKWNWTDNKNIDIDQTFNKLGIKNVINMPNQQVNIDGSATDIISATKGYLFANSDNTGNQGFVFARRRIDTESMMGAAILKDGTKPERPIIVSPNPQYVSGTPYMGVGFCGYEQIVGACVNKYACSEFNRI